MGGIESTISIKGQLFCRICKTSVKYEFVNNEYRTRSCECGAVTKVYDLKGKQLFETELKKVAEETSERT